MKFLSINNLLRTQKGAALAMALMLLGAAAILLTIFLNYQLSAGRQVFAQRDQLQALATARSGIYRALAYHDTIDTFKAQLVSKQPIDTSTTIDSTLFSGSPFVDTTFGTCTETDSFEGVYRRIISTAQYRNKSATVQVLFGGSFFTSPETTLYSMAGIRPTGGFRLDGRIGKIVAGDSSKLLNEKQMKRCFAQLGEVFTSDTVFPGDIRAPIRISTVQQWHDLPSEVRAPLMIDGTFGTLELIEPRQIVVYDTVQVTGNVILHNADIIAKGSVKLFDKTKFIACKVFTGNTFAVGDQAQFSGTAIASTKILLFDRAQILNKSLLICRGEALSKTQSLLPPTEPFNFFISGKSKVNATCIALGTSAGIKTDKESSVEGIILTAGSLCHRGIIRGIVHAPRMVDCGDTPTFTHVENASTGTVSRLQDIADWPLPIFIGKPKVLRWDE